jgi:hypothetical protein
MNAIETTQQANQPMSGHPVMISAARHSKRGGLMIAILGSRKQVLRQPR